MKIEIKTIFGDVKISGDFSSFKEAVTKNKSNLRGASLCGANLCGANLRDASLRDASLCGASLRGADLRDADLRGADLRDASLCGANLRGANLRGANLRDADLCGADLRDADLCDASLRGASLCGASLRGADLRGADLCGEKIKTFKIVNGAYKHTIIIMLTTDGKRIVKMGCLKKTLEEWDAIGIRNSNPSEFPDDKSFASEQRVIAFEYAKQICLLLS